LDVLRVSGPAASFLAHQEFKAGFIPASRLGEGLKKSKGFRMVLILEKHTGYFVGIGKRGFFEKCHYVSTGVFAGREMSMKRLGI
jgi:hypothetical protein